MGDARRFSLFADLCSRNLRKAMRVADVAGGKGHLQAALRELGFSDVTSWDRVKKYAGNRRGYRWGLFDYREAPDYDAVVAMHPDGGTDHAVMYGVERRVPVVVCPCCAIPSASNYWGPKRHQDWVEHLVGLGKRGGMRVTRTSLPMRGRSEVLIMVPERR